MQSVVQFDTFFFPTDIELIYCCCGKEFLSSQNEVTYYEIHTFTMKLMQLKVRTLSSDCFPPFTDDENYVMQIEENCGHDLSCQWNHF